MSIAARKKNERKTSPLSSRDDKEVRSRSLRVYCKARAFRGKIHSISLYLSSGGGGGGNDDDDDGGAMWLQFLTFNQPPTHTKLTRSHVKQSTTKAIQQLVGARREKATADC